MAKIRQPSNKALGWLLSSLLVAVTVTLVTVIFFAHIAPSASAQPYSPAEKLKLLANADFLKVFVLRDYWLTVFPCLASFLVGAKIENARHQNANVM